MFFFLISKNAWLTEYAVIILFRFLFDIWKKKAFGPTGTVNKDLSHIVAIVCGGGGGGTGHVWNHWNIFGGGGRRGETVRLFLFSMGFKGK